MNRDPIQAILAGGLSAALMVPLAMFPLAGVLFGWFLPLPLFWAAWGMGHKAGTMAAMVAIAGCGLLMGPVIALAYGLFIVFPAWFTGRQLLLKRPSPNGADQWYPLGEGLAKVTVYYAALLVAVLASIASGLNQGTTIFGALGDSLSDQGIQDLIGVNPEAAAQTISIIQAVGPGMGVAMLVTMGVTSALLAQTILVRQGRNVRPPFELLQFDLPQRLGILWVLVGFVALVTDGNVGFIADNVFIVIAVPYFFLGLAVVHAYAAGHRQRTLILFGVYLLMVIIGWVVVLIMALGLFENWSGIRNRVKRNVNSRGSGPDNGDDAP